MSSRKYISIEVTRDKTLRKKGSNFSLFQKKANYTSKWSCSTEFSKKLVSRSFEVIRGHPRSSKNRETIYLNFASSSQEGNLKIDILGKEPGDLKNRDSNHLPSDFETECASAKLAQITIDHDSTPGNSELVIESDRPKKVIGSLQRRIQKNILEPNADSPLNFQKSL